MHRAPPMGIILGDVDAVPTIGSILFHSERKRGVV